MTLLLRGQTRSDRCFGAPASATTLQLCGQTRSDQCFGIPASATALLLRGQACSDRCFGTPTSATAPKYCIVPSATYYVVSYSFLMMGLGSQTVI